MSLPGSLRVFLGTLFLLTATCIACKFFSAHVLHLGPPYSMFVQGDLGDLHAYADIMPSFHRYEFMRQDARPPYMYPAPVALLYVVFYAIPHKEAAMYALIAGTFLVAAALLGRAMVRRGAGLGETVGFLVVTLVCSYPLYYEIHAGNMEIFLFLLLAVAAWAIFKDRPMLAAVCISIAGAMKLYPFALAGVLLARRQYRALAVGVAVGAALTLISLASITPSIAYSWHAVSRNLAMYQRVFVGSVDPAVIGYDHSLFALIKRVIVGFREPFTIVRAALLVYTPVAGLAGLALFFLKIRKLPLLNQLILLITAAVFLSPSSYDYTLMLLYVPWGALVLFAIESASETVPGLTAILAGFAGLLATEEEFIHHGSPFGGQIRAVVFLAVFGLALRYPLLRRSLPERRSSQGLQSERLAVDRSG